jgi:hypothetical protein
MLEPKDVKRSSPPSPVAPRDARSPVEIDKARLASIAEAEEARKKLVAEKAAVKTEKEPTRTEQVLDAVVKHTVGQDPAEKKAAYAALAEAVKADAAAQKVAETPVEESVVFGVPAGHQDKITEAERNVLAEANALMVAGDWVRQPSDEIVARWTHKGAQDAKDVTLLNKVAAVFAAANWTRRY